MRKILFSVILLLFVICSSTFADSKYIEIRAYDSNDVLIPNIQIEIMDSKDLNKIIHSAFTGEDGTGTFNLKPKEMTSNNYYRADIKHRGVYIARDYRFDGKIYHGGEKVKTKISLDKYFGAGNYYRMNIPENGQVPVGTRIEIRNMERDIHNVFVRTSNNKTPVIMNLQDNFSFWFSNNFYWAVTSNYANAGDLTFEFYTKDNPNTPKYVSKPFRVTPVNSNIEEVNYKYYSWRNMKQSDSKEIATICEIEFELIGQLIPYLNWNNSVFGAYESKIDNIKLTKAENYLGDAKFVFDGDFKTALQKDGSFNGDGLELALENELLCNGFTIVTNNSLNENIGQNFYGSNDGINWTKINTELCSKYQIDERKYLTYVVTSTAETSQYNFDNNIGNDETSHIQISDRMLSFLSKLAYYKTSSLSIGELISSNQELASLLYNSNLNVEIKDISHFQLLMTEDFGNGFSGYAIYDPENKTVVFTFRGTNFKESKDVYTDISLALGDESFNQYYSAERFVKIVLESLEIKDHRGKIYVTGHSLGGYLANLIGMYLVDTGKYDVSTVSFEAPGISNDYFGIFSEDKNVRDLAKKQLSKSPITERQIINIKNNAYDNNIKNLLICDDPVSLFGMHPGKDYVASMYHNYIPEKQKIYEALYNQFLNTHNISNVVLKSSFYDDNGNIKEKYLNESFIEDMNLFVVNLRGKTLGAINDAGNAILNPLASSADKVASSMESKLIPKDSISHEELLTMVIKMKGVEEEAKTFAFDCPFTDVPKDYFMYSEISFAGYTALLDCENNKTFGIGKAVDENMVYGYMLSLMGYDGYKKSNPRPDAEAVGIALPTKSGNKILTRSEIRQIIFATIMNKHIDGTAMIDKINQDWVVESGYVTMEDIQNHKANGSERTYFEKLSYIIPKSAKISQIKGNENYIMSSFGNDTKYTASRIDYNGTQTYIYVVHSANSKKFFKTMKNAYKLPVNGLKRHDNRVKYSDDAFYLVGKDGDKFVNKLYISEGNTVYIISIKAYPDQVDDDLYDMFDSVELKSPYK
jgi:hypothetical protein